MLTLYFDARAIWFHCISHIPRWQPCRACSQVLALARARATPNNTLSHSISIYVSSSSSSAAAADAVAVLVLTNKWSRLIFIRVTYAIHWSEKYIAIALPCNLARDFRAAFNHGNNSAFLFFFFSHFSFTFYTLFRFRGRCAMLFFFVFCQSNTITTIKTCTSTKRTIILFAFNLWSFPFAHVKYFI